jgi:hypothetical protein
MSERFRITIILLALDAVALGCYNVANPYRPGQIGYDATSLASGNQVFERVYPGSRAAMAELRSVAATSFPSQIRTLA